MEKEKSNSNSMKIHEVAIVYKRPLFSDMEYIGCSSDVNTFLRKVIDLDKVDLKEIFWVILLNNANRVLGFSEISIGDAKGVVVNIMEIFQLIIKANASSIIVSHNHPSGKLIASENDKEITAKLKKASNLFSISFLDHIIITSESYFSFADEGIL